MPTSYYYTICYQIKANMTLALGQYIIVPYLSHGKEEEGGGECIFCFALQMWLRVRKTIIMEVAKLFAFHTDGVSPLLSLFLGAVNIALHVAQKHKADSQPCSLMTQKYEDW